MTTADLILALATMLSANYGGKLFEHYLRKRRLKNDLSLNNMNVNYDYRVKVEEVCELLRHRLQASRVLICSFSNGDITYGGYHMKKISVTAEVNALGVELLAPDFQLIPAATFRRPLDLLHYSPNSYAYSDECLIQDSLSSLNRSYGIQSMHLVKILDEMQRWIGYLLISYDECSRPLPPEEISYLQLQASRIGAIKYHE